MSYISGFKRRGASGRTRLLIGQQMAKNRANNQRRQHEEYRMHNGVLQVIIAVRAATAATKIADASAKDKCDQYQHQLAPF